MTLFRTLRPFFLFASLLLLASLVLEHINDRFWLNDLRVYYMAADNLRHGLPIYGEAFGLGTGLYKYAPVVLYFFLPYTFLPFHAAGILHFLGTGVLLMWAFVGVERSLAHFRPALPKAATRAVLGLLCIAVLLARELHMGNINVGLLLLAVLGVERLLAGKRASAGILFGLAWLVKPYLLLMLVPLAIRRERRVLGAALATILAGLLLPLPFHGPGLWWELHREWGASMLLHTGMMTSPDRIGAILGKLLGFAPSTGLDLAFIALAGNLLAALAWANQRRERIVGGRGMDTAFELWLAMALVPNLVITDQQHFMFALPLILFTLACLFTHRHIPLLLGFLLAFLLYGTRSTDLWGKGSENILVGWGVLGSGNILLMAVAFAAWRCWRRQAAAPPIT